MYEPGILPGYSLKMVKGEDIHELSDYDHASSFLFVSRFWGASAGTGPNLDPGDGTAAGQ
jgi:hypothetical protein